MGSVLLLLAVCRAAGLIELRILTLSIRDSYYEQIKNTSDKRFYQDRLPIRITYYALLTTLLLRILASYGVLQFTGTDYIILISLLLLFLTTLHFLRKAAGSVFKFKTVIEQVQIKEATNTDVLVVILLIANFFLVYPGYSNLNLTLVLAAFVVIARVLCVIRLLLYFRQYILDHFLYFILYLCALEIAPYLLLYSVLLGI